MAVDTKVPRSRRAVLGAALGAVGALTARALGQPDVARAGTDGDVVLGAENESDQTTTIRSTAVGYSLRADGVKETGLDGFGTSGLAGVSLTGVGVGAFSDKHIGLWATSGEGVAVSAESFGLSSDGAASIQAHGYSCPAIDVTGVNAPVVKIRTVLDEDGGPGNGIALQVGGRTLFNRSGRATVPAGRAYADVSLVDRGLLSGTPLCFANVMSYRPGVWVTMVRPRYPSTFVMRIYLNKAPTSNTYVAWFVLG